MTYKPSIEQRDTLWYASLYDTVAREEVNLGNFPSEVAAKRSVEDTVARLTHAAEVQAAADKERAELTAAEQKAAPKAKS